VFDFDLFTVRLPGQEAPGTELLSRYGSRAADTQGSSNLIGVKDPAVDALLDKVVSSTTRPQLIASLRALDRVLRHGHYVIPQWYAATYRVSYRAGKFEQPKVAPDYYRPEDWVLTTWWRKR
jgi:microcin C transport system substrate-binding protein